MTEPLRQLLYRGVPVAELPSELWRRRRVALGLIIVSSILTAALWAVLPRWYASDASLTVDSGTQLPLGGSVLGLASQLGLGSVGAASTSPQFYSDLLGSRAVLDRLLDAPLPLRDSLRKESLDVYWNHGSAAGPRAHQQALEKLARHLSASANPRTGVVTLTIEAPTPQTAKLMVDTALAVLNQLVLGIRQQHASDERLFLEGRFRDLRDSLDAHEDSLRRFYERNRQVTSPALQFEEQRLRREVDRTQTVFVQVGTQLEQARIQEVRDIPAISVIDSAVAPVKKSSPSLKLMLVAAWAITALVILTITLLSMATGELQRSQR